MDLHTDYNDDLGIPLVHQSVNVIDDFFPVFDDMASSATSRTTGEHQLTAEEEPLRWIIDELPPFPDLEYLIHEFVTQTEDNIITSSYDIDPPQISSRSTQLRSVGDTIIISDDKMDSPQIPNEVQQGSTPAEPPPTVELLIETPQLEGRRLDTSHKYNTRRAYYKKQISEFIKEEQTLLNGLRKNQQRPKAHDSSTPHGQWIHSKDWVNINLLRVDIPVKKVPNYSLMKHHRTRKARSKKVPVISTTS